MDAKLCNERYERLSGDISINTKRLNRHSEKMDSIIKDQISMGKDNSRLDEVIGELRKAVESLNVTVSLLEKKPLEKYEKIAWLFVGGVVSYIVSVLFK